MIGILSESAFMAFFSFSVDFRIFALDFINLESKE